MSLASLLSVQMLSPPGQEEFGTFSESFRTNSALSLHSAHYHTQINRLMQEHSSNASVIFTSLPAIPDDLREAKDFYDAMDTLSCEFTVLSARTCTVLLEYILRVKNLCK